MDTSLDSWTSSGEASGGRYDAAEERPDSDSDEDDIDEQGHPDSFDSLNTRQLRSRTKSGAPDRVYGGDNQDDDEDLDDAGADLFDIGVWDAMGVLHSETVRYHDRCRYCSTIQFREFVCGETPYETGRDGTGKVHELQLRIQDFSQKVKCWLCRFLFRICVRAMTRDTFRQCWQDEAVLVLKQAPGLLAHRLMISSSDQGCCKIELLESRDSKDVPTVLKRYYEHGLDDFLITCQDRNEGSSASSRTVNEVLTTALHDGFLDYEMLLSWVCCCEKEHAETCNLKVEPTMRETLYLIDVDSFAVVEAEPGSRYVALSYVLGGYQPSMNKDSWRLPNPLPEDVPRTVLDAISVVQNMGEKYLWVDIYCIPQDPILRYNIIREMDYIYDGAFITICALTGEDAESGLYGVSIPFRKPNQVVTSTKSHDFMAMQVPLLWIEFDDTAWGGRAWTFQEAALSRRRLCFSRVGVFLICKEELFHGLIKLQGHSENQIAIQVDKKQMEDLPFDIDLNHVQWDFRAYYRIATAFCGRRLTYQSDAGNAIAGPLNRMSVSSKVEFAYGLPTQDLLNALLFNRPGLPKRSSATRDTTMLKRRPGFPSWSWLGWQGNLTYSFWLRESNILSVYNLVGIMSTYEYAVSVRQSASIRLENAGGSENSCLVISSEMARFRLGRGRRKEREKVGDGFDRLRLIAALSPAPIMREIDPDYYLVAGLGNETFNLMAHPSQRNAVKAGTKMSGDSSVGVLLSDQITPSGKRDGEGETEEIDRGGRSRRGDAVRQDIEIGTQETADEDGDDTSSADSLLPNEGEPEIEPPISLQHRQHVWQMLDGDGNVLPCSRARLLYGDKLGNIASTEDLWLPDDVSLQFVRDGEKELGLEFMLLQRWESVPFVVERLQQREERKEVNEWFGRLYDFGSEVWAMGIRRVRDGLEKGGELNGSADQGEWERVCVVMMPSEQWLAANPQKATVRVF
ncbi:uncharacterized protein A1O5_10680 [Cladophialophora psammophila CBS 110553]|uniref:Heterokaryon incompatibility domain-containing protein n=1 Tax=Cladophialophora psammophila CBS 110553 TaxID=1182543 RepID=W9WN48_9EURO|nr:uncharacterized protein A1O5_10680 [Cladophialophora psammophila CBS 110553]EXJ66066.1 hypothetical protein A1O5_10680 [Cladophialophora psammophila CBS 110553]